MYAALWKDFRNSCLIAARKFHEDRSVQRTLVLKIRDYVLIQPENLMTSSLHKKIYWERAKITGFKISAKCTRQRLVLLEKYNGDGTSTKIERPILRLFPLEVLPDEEYAKVPIPKSEKSNEAQAKNAQETMQIFHRVFRAFCAKITTAEKANDTH